MDSQNTYNFPKVTPTDPIALREELRSPWRGKTDSQAAGVPGSDEQSSASTPAPSADSKD